MNSRNLPTFCSSHRRARWRKQAAHVQQEPNNLLKVGSIMRNSYVIYLQLDRAVSANITTHQIECLQFDRPKLHCGLPGTSLKQHPSKILIFVTNAFVSPYYNPKVACHHQMKLNGSKWWRYHIQTPNPQVQKLSFLPWTKLVPSDSALFAESKVKHYEHCTL